VKKLLDHGYLDLVEHWGSDQRIVETARMSTNKGFLGWGPSECPECKGASVGVDLLVARTGDTSGACSKCNNTGQVPGDEKLLRYLHEHAHSTPFEFAGLTIEVKAPIMVFREWHRHRVPFGYNEMSARYVPLPDENYSPTVGRIVEGARAAGKNKQAQAATDAAVTDDDALEWLAALADVYGHAQRVYELGLKLGVPKELARLPVPVGRYSRMRATGNLRGWLGFMTLRSAPNAQWEIRQFSHAIGEVVAEMFPCTWTLFAEGRP
jgi:thymidylate synthase (FAD)